MPRRRLSVIVSTIVFAAAVTAIAASAAPRSMPTDRTWERLTPPGREGPRRTLRDAARALGDWRIRLAGVGLDGRTVARLAATPADEPLVRALRESLGRPIDLDDFLHFLDDLAAAGHNGLHGQPVFVPSGRARGAGILLHPADVFGGTPKRYGGRPLAIFRPERPADLEPAGDGTPLGPRWTARFRNPSEEDDMLAALEHARRPDFAQRLSLLLAQLRAQGAEAYLFSTVRSRERGYLIYGAFVLSRAESATAVTKRVRELERLNREWELHVPIRWRHPGGWQATVRAAGRMAAAYNVVYATRRGARHSSHYGGRAVDFAAMDLPRELTLTAPGGHPSRTFDLSHPDEPRDLNLTPRLISWVEDHFELSKLRSDYPHWTDARGG